MDNNLDYSSEIKKGIISLLMFQLYSDERTIYREYVQNALDSINMAVAEHLLDQPKDGMVNINIDRKKKVIKIKDNGTGIPSADAVRIMLDISASTKNGIAQAGQFGIGRLVGGGYCHELIFRTSSRGEDIATQVTFDVDRIWKMVKEDKEDYLATYVINECTKRETIPAEETEHYFEVELNGVKDDSAPALLNSDEVIEYLREVAPVEYKPEFKNTLIYKSTADNPEFKDFHEGLEKVQIFVGETRIQKQYGLTIKGTKDKIKNLEYFKIEHPKYGMLGWGWFALTRFTIHIPKEDTLAGIRLRAHNIQVGDSSQLSGTKYWKEERSNSYFYGEFFVTHPNICPNGARDGLVPTPETNALAIGLKSYFENLKKLYEKANAAKKSVDKINEGIKEIKSKGGVPDYHSKDLINNKGIGMFDKLMKAQYGIDAIKRMLLLYQPGYIDAKAQAEELLKPKPKPEKQQEEDPAKATPSVDVPNTTDMETPSEVPNQTSATQTTSDITNEIETQPTSTMEAGGGQQEATGVQKPATYQHESLLPGQPVIVPTTTPLLGQQDIIAPLNNILDSNEVWLLRRVFRVLNSYCPNNEHDQKLIAAMERLIVNEFINEN